MTSQILVAVLGAVVLLGAAVVLVSRADHRRESRQQRLRSLVMVGPSADEPVLPLRRPILRRTGREFSLLTTARARLEAAFAATGNRIRLPHLTLTMLIVATAVIVFAARIMWLKPALVTLLGVAGGLAAPALLLHLAQSRYRNQFLDRFPDALDLIGRAVKAGLPVLDAMEVAAHEIPAPVGGELQRTIEEMRIGVDVDEAMQDTADRIRVPDFPLLCGRPKTATAHWRCPGRDPREPQPCHPPPQRDTPQSSGIELRVEVLGGRPCTAAVRRRRCNVLDQP
jgi:tight adherence protein B